MIKLLLFYVILIQFIVETNSIWKRFDLVRPWGGTGSTGNQPYTKIGKGIGGGPEELKQDSKFGYSVCNIGDLNNDGIDDIAVGAIGESNLMALKFYDTNSSESRPVQSLSGAVYILFMNESGLASSYQRIGGDDGNSPSLWSFDRFGHSITALGDLDGDGIRDIAVGAPGKAVSSVWILFLNTNGTVKDYQLIRGNYNEQEVRKALRNETNNYNQDESNLNSTISYYAANPPTLLMHYRMGFGYAMTTLGDFDEDGVIDIAVSTGDTSVTSVYILYLRTNGIVKSFMQIASNTNGAPYIPFDSGFGSSMVTLRDINGDNITDLAVGARYQADNTDGDFDAGSFYIFFLNANGSVKESILHTKYSQEEDGEKFILPFLKDDNCGAAMTNIGDINLDNRASQRPWLTREAHGKESRPSIEDVVIGCPQYGSTTRSGRLFLVFMDQYGTHKGYREIPHPKKDLDYNVFPRLSPGDALGCSLDAYADVDNNGLREMIVGAFGDDHNSTFQDTGAVYLFFLRRRRWHPFSPDTNMYIFSIAFPLSFCCFSCIVGTIYFFWYYRRKPDLVELAVKNSDIKIGKKRERKKANLVVVSNDDEYPD